MDAGQIWALIWVLSIAGLVVAGVGGNAAIDKTPTGIGVLVCTLGMVFSTIACVWIAAGLHLSLGVS